MDLIDLDEYFRVVSEGGELSAMMEKMAALVPSDKPYMRTSVWETYKKRIPWLLLLMVSATFTGSIITSFEDALSVYVALTAFIPMLMDTGGNAGGQASVTIIRGLSLGEIGYGDVPKIVPQPRAARHQGRPSGRMDRFRTRCATSVSTHRDNAPRRI